MSSHVVSFLIYDFFQESGAWGLRGGGKKKEHQIIEQYKILLEWIRLIATLIRTNTEKMYQPKDRYVLFVNQLLQNAVTVPDSVPRCTERAVYRMSRKKCARLRENIPYVKVRRSNPKHLYPKLNGYGDNGQRKVWSSCGSTYCTCFVCCYPYTAHVRPSVSQPSQAHSDFIIDRCHS